MFARLKALLVAAVPSKADVGAVALVSGVFALFGPAVAAIVAGALLMISEVAG